MSFICIFKAAPSVGGYPKPVADAYYRDAHVSGLVTSIEPGSAYFGSNEGRLAAKSIECVLESADSAG